MTFPISGDSSFALGLHARYLREPSSVPADVRHYFDTLGIGPRTSTIDAGSISNTLLRAYRDNSFAGAELDPLGIIKRELPTEIASANRLAYGRTVTLELGGTTRTLDGKDAIELLRTTYCGHAALEAAHLFKSEERDWLYKTFEREVMGDVGEALWASTLESVLLADEFERFIKTKWPAKKRFGIEGSECSAVIAREIFSEAAAKDYEEVVIGGMHRGRLATLATVFGKSLPTLIAEIKGTDVTQGSAFFTGDVPYHNGLAAAVSTERGHLNIRVMPHPSHLIVVAPVAMGAARGRQEVKQHSGNGGKVLPLLMHTDAAFEGQGLVSEILQLGGLKGYSVGGTIHLVVNNQIGFTTLPEEGRSTPSPTDIGKAYGIPILHVNGDDPIAAAATARVALAWRDTFHRDAIIDLVCYRRSGHNELDEPRFTQPQTWAAVDQHLSLKKSYSTLVQAHSIQAHERAEQRRVKFSTEMEHAYATYENHRSNSAVDETIVFPETRSSKSEAYDSSTGIPADQLMVLARQLTSLPDDMEIDPKVRAFGRARLESVTAGKGINLATAESLAFASLLSEGIGVRLSGQDSVRGTFTQRHLTAHDKTTGRQFTPLSTVAENGCRFEAINSPLIEYGVLSFEYGLSLADPDRLIVWEAQFGDFLNLAQTVVDQFIVTAEAKWRIHSSLVIALPHGLEGQGPDHSSARIERILQSAVGNNIIVANPSTPANLFHLLRRQQKGSERKPLFLIAPKSLLRDKRCVSELADFQPGTSFQSLLVNKSASTYKRIVLCSGKIYYVLADARREGRFDSVLLGRIEQLYPFPADAVKELLEEFGEAEIGWCQEEPKNQGAYAYVRDQLAELAPTRPLAYFGRPPMAAAAGGSIERHEEEQAEIVAASFTGLQRGSDRLAAE